MWLDSANKTHWPYFEHDRTFADYEKIVGEQGLYFAGTNLSDC